MQVSFDQPAHVLKRDARAREEYWRLSHRLGHGTLAVLWWEPDGPAQPRLALGVICERDPKKLAAKDGGRPVIGLRCALQLSSARGARCGRHRPEMLIAAVVGLRCALWLSYQCH
jgi:hypothetical protein